MLKYELAYSFLAEKKNNELQNSVAISISSGLSYSLEKEWATAIRFLPVLSWLAISRNEMDVCFAEANVLLMVEIIN